MHSQWWPLSTHISFLSLSQLQQGISVESALSMRPRSTYSDSQLTSTGQCQALRTPGPTTCGRIAALGLQRSATDFVQPTRKRRPETCGKRAGTRLRSIEVLTGERSCRPPSTERRQRIDPSVLTMVDCRAHLLEVSQRFKVLYLNAQSCGNKATVSQPLS